MRTARMYCVSLRRSIGNRPSVQRTHVHLLPRLVHRSPPDLDRSVVLLVHVVRATRPHLESGGEVAGQNRSVESVLLLPIRVHVDPQTDHRVVAVDHLQGTVGRRVEDEELQEVERVVVLRLFVLGLLQIVADDRLGGCGLWTMGGRTGSEVGDSENHNQAGVQHENVPHS